MALLAQIILYNDHMKLNGANFLELSLSLAFALVVLTTTIFLLQESIERVNKAISFNTYQNQSTKLLHQIKSLSYFNFNTSDSGQLSSSYYLELLNRPTSIQMSTNPDFNQASTYLSSASKSIVDYEFDTLSNFTLTKYKYNYIIDSYYESFDHNFDLMKIIINHSSFNYPFYLYLSTSATKQVLNGLISSIKLALDSYFQVYGEYPPSRRLDYLISGGILNQLPNNPYTSNNEISNLNEMNHITDWHYINNGGVLTLFAYTHPNILISWAQ